MNGLLAELGKRLAERWLTLLVLPGALYLATLGAAVTLGHLHALDVDRLVARIGELADPHPSGGIVLILVCSLIAAGGAGLAAQALGSMVERLWLAADWRAWPRPLRHAAQRRIDARRQRWTTAYTRYTQAREDAARAFAEGRLAGRADSPVTILDDAYRGLVAVAEELPARPTWMGDRVQAVTERLDRNLNLALSAVWPSLWLVVPDTTRSEVTAARDALARATTLAGWSMLYLATGLLWWPSAVIAAATAVTSWRRARVATAQYADLIEATARLHAGDLAQALGFDHQGPVTPDLGLTLTEHLQHRPVSR